MKFSIIIPVYNCSSSLRELTERLKKTLLTLSDDFEIIFVNDTSTENDWEIITELAKKDNRIKGINFSRNFGQHYAITAGLDIAKGDWVVVMDGDLQDQPEEIIKLYNKVTEGFDLVVGKRTQRQDSIVKKLTSKFYQKIFNYLTEQNISYETASFGIYSKKVISNVIRFKEEFRSFGIIVYWVGFKRVEIEIKHGKRIHGKTAYNFRKRSRLAIDSIISHSDKPLRIFFKLGLFMSFMSLLFSIFITIKYFFMNATVAGWTSTIVSLFFLSGLIIASLGFIGLYIGRIFKQVKERPLYIIRDKVNINE